MPFGLTYQDYLREAPGLNASENATIPMSEAEWNAIPMQQQWGLLGHGYNGITVNQYDPRYQGLTTEFGGSGGDNNDFIIGRGQFDPQHNRTANGSQAYNDPSMVHNHEGYFVTPTSNSTADAQREDQWSFARNAALMYAALATGGAMSGAGLGAGASAAPAMETAVGGGFGTGALGAGGTGAAFGAGAGAGVGAGAFDFSPHQYTGQFSGGSGVGSLGPDFVPAGAAGGAAGGAGGASGGGGLLGGNSVGSLASQAGTWAMNNPIRALGLVQTGYGLLNRDGGGSSGGGGSGGSNVSKGGSGVPPQPQQGPSNFYVNPYTLAQIQRSYQNG